MNKTILSLIAVSATAVTLSACSMMEDQTATSLPPGHYENTSSSTNGAGTETQNTKSTDVYRDADGDKHAVVHSKTTKNPKGLFNKTTTESSTKKIN